MLEVFSYNYGNAAGDSGCADGANQLLNMQIWQNIAHKRHDIDVNGNARQLSATQDVALLNERLASKAANAVTNNNFFITLGGDHSCGIGSWSGASAQSDNLGLLWVDAHLDSHTNETSESKNIHGMPVAALLGEGDSRLSALHNNDTKIKGENLCIFGARSFEDAEAELLKHHNVRIFTNTEISQRGFDVCLTEAMQRITNNTTAIGLSIDVDGIDPEFAPAVGTPAKAGLSPQQIFAIIDACKQQNWLGLEIAEFNPHKDLDLITEKLLEEIIKRAI